MSPLIHLSSRVVSPRRDFEDLQTYFRIHPHFHESFTLTCLIVYLLKDDVIYKRVCNLVSRPDYDGFGFSLRSSDTGLHQVSLIEAESPAQMADLREDDLILKVNGVNVLGERYIKTVSIIKNESLSGRVKLEVISTADLA